MIDERTFYRVREIITGRRPRKSEHYVKLNPEFPLRRIARCIHCGAPLSGAFSVGRNKNRKIGYYGCPTRNIYKPNQSFPVKDVHDQFNELLGMVEFDDGAIAWVTEMVKESYETKYKTHLKSEKKAELELGWGVRCFRKESFLMEKNFEHLLWG